jgi:hypothetical protein
MTRDVILQFYALRLAYFVQTKRDELVGFGVASIADAMGNAGWHTYDLACVKRFCRLSLDFEYGSTSLYQEHFLPIVIMPLHPAPRALLSPGYNNAPSVGYFEVALVKPGSDWWRSLHLPVLCGQKQRAECTGNRTNGCND